MMTPSQKIKSSLKIFVIVLYLSGYGTTSMLYAQSEEVNNHLKTVSPNDYSQWEYIRGYRLSKDGNWLNYQVNNGDLDKNIFIYNTNTKVKKEIKNADRAIFSDNSMWMAYTKALTGKEAKKLEKNKQKDKDKKSKKKPKNIGLINLKTNDTLEFKDVENFKFSGTESFIAMKRIKDKVNTLIVKNLTSNVEISFGNVSEYAWQDKGTLLAFVIKTKDSVGNAIQLYDPNTGNIKVLDHKKAVYQNLKWRKESNDLFAIRTVKNKDYKDNSYDLLLWKGLNTKKSSHHVFDPTKYSNFPKDTRLLSRGISFSEDGNIVFFNTFNWDKEMKKKDISKKDTVQQGNKKEVKKQKDVTADDEAPAVEIWNSKDRVIIPAQKKSRMKDLAEPKLAKWNIKTNKFVLLEDDLTETVQLQVDNEILIGLDRTPYDFEAMFGRPNDDVYTVNTNTGGKKKVLSKINQVWDVSPNDQFFVYLNKDNLHLFNINKGKTSNITQGLDAVFINFESDHPLPQKPAFGFGGWAKDSKSFFIYSEFDVWQIFINGSKSKKITNGKKDNIIYRITKLDRSVENIDTSKPVYFTMFGKWTKKSGIAFGTPGKNIKTLIYKDAKISWPSKAKNANSILFTEQSYTQSSNLFLTNTTYDTPKQISNTNTFQKEYAWGKNVLVEYINAGGKKAQGILYYPANYVKGKKYPMITYIYEKLSNGLHSYIPPSRTSYYNTTVWVQNGYFVFNPDVEFIKGKPGESSTKVLENAVKAVVERGDVDAKRVGLIGHSWGGYQAGYVPTQTNIFAASVAGAGLTELISMNLAVTPAFGGRPENDHFEVGQERMGSAPWKSPDNYLRNSSVMQIEKLNTPILFEVGDNDQNVNWSQGIAYYNAARRAGKPFVLLVYAKEGHGLRNKKNQIDYQQRILKWFGHYLKDEKAEDWILNGIPYAEQQRVLKNWKKK